MRNQFKELEIVLYSLIHGSKVN